MYRRKRLHTELRKRNSNFLNRARDNKDENYRI